MSLERIIDRLKAEHPSLPSHATMRRHLRRPGAGDGTGGVGSYRFSATLSSGALLSGLMGLPERGVASVTPRSGLPMKLVT